MKITKLFTLFAILTGISSVALAKTEGNYFSGSIIYNRASLNQGSSGTNDINYKDTANAAGFGVAYKRAFNYNNIFIAPGVFAEKNNLKSTVGSTTVNIKNRYGFKADLGYDLENDLAIYLTGGLSFLSYKTTNDAGKESDNARSSWFYGAGIRQDYSENVSFDLEYNTQSFSALTMSSHKVKVDDNTVKIGLNYKF
jgi:opacity protein-like surface antigen